MEQALDEEDFISENTPLMVEAIPSGGDGIMIIVTKVNNKEKHADEDLRRWKKEAHGYAGASGGKKVRIF